MINSFNRTLLLIIVLMIPFSMSSRPAAINQLPYKLGHQHSNERSDQDDGKISHQDSTEAIRRASMVVQSAAGSRLPDCSHACGSCMPCRLVIVGSACASLTEAESCPISYRCMCNNKTYPVP